MDYEYDPAKNAANMAKHGFPLSDAVLLDWDTAVTYPDTRHDYGEDRKKALGHIGARLYCVIFVDRGDVRRIISLRKANKREFKDYVRDLERR